MCIGMLPYCLMYLFVFQLKAGSPASQRKRSFSFQSTFLFFLFFHFSHFPLYISMWMGKKNSSSQTRNVFHEQNSLWELCSMFFANTFSVFPLITFTELDLWTLMQSCILSFSLPDFLLGRVLLMSSTDFQYSLDSLTCLEFRVTSRAAWQILSVVNGL